MAKISQSTIIQILDAIGGPGNGTERQLHDPACVGH